MDRRDRRIAMWIIVGGLAAQLPALVWQIPDAKVINNALRILDGEVPYRDFWSMYAPGYSYLVALLFNWFGQHVWVQAIAHQLIVAVDAALVFIIARHIGLERPLAALAGAAFVGIHWQLAPSITPYEPALLLLLLAWRSAIGYAERGRASDLILAGLLSGFGAWFKHDVAFYVTLSIVGGLTVSWFLAADRRPPTWLHPVIVAVCVWGGALVTVLPVVLFLAYQAGRDAWQDLIVFPATDFAVVRGDGYTSPVPPVLALITSLAQFDPGAIFRTGNQLGAWLTTWVPLSICGAGVLGVAAHRRELDASRLAVASIAVSGMPLFLASAYVQHNTNPYSLWVLSLMFGSTVWTRLRGSPRYRQTIAIALSAFTVGLLVAPALRIARAVYAWPDHRVLDFPLVAGVRTARVTYDNHYTIVSLIREHVPEDEPIYVGLGRHDSVVINNASFYYLSGRRNATRYSELHPGVVDREEIQREMINDLERSRVRCVVLWDFGWSRTHMDEILAERRRKIPELGATLLDEFIADNYQQIARFGEYRLLWRKGLPPPSIPPAVVAQ